MTLDTHCRAVVKAMARGDVVPLIGAGANLCDRAAEQPWALGECLPSGSELARHLAQDFDYPLPDDTDLLRVSEFVDLSCGEGPLYKSLHRIFAADYPPTSLHRFLATLPEVLAEPGSPRRHMLVVTTNYDDLLERAFDAAGEPYDVVVYQAAGPHRGRFVHTLPGGEERLIDKPNEYRELSMDDRSAVLKIHGAADRDPDGRDSYVITEDHYIEYLAHASAARLLPVRLLAKLLRSHFLFLGYRLRDWNLRVILHQLWRERDLGYRSWAVHRDPDPLDRELWRRRDVDVYDVPLDEYVHALRHQLSLASETTARH
jgi:hypothetical protein